MQIDELRKAIRSKTNEFEIALALKKPYTETKQIYRELKKLHYQLVQLENNLQTA